MIYMKNLQKNTWQMPVLKGIKSKSETFAGAETTYCIEALMQDGKACKLELLIF